MGPPIILALLFVSFTLSEDVSNEALSKTFTSFNSEDDLYKLIHDAYQAKVFSDTGVFVESVGIDIIKGIPPLNDFFVSTGMLSPSGIQYENVRTYLDQNLDLRNMLVRATIIDSALNYNPDSVKDIFTRYNENTGTLDPKVETGKPDTTTTYDLGNFALESVTDVYDIILKMYRFGLFDRDGNFIESALVSLLKTEPNLATMMKTPKIVNDNLQADASQFVRFLTERPALSNLLSAAGVYREGRYFPTAVSAVIFRYNKDTKQLDIPPSIPVVDQVALDQTVKDEMLAKQAVLDTTLTTTAVFNELVKNPEANLRQALAYGRRNGVFDIQGNFDYVNFYLLASQDEDLGNLLLSTGIYDTKGNFFLEKLYNTIAESATLWNALKRVGVVTSAGGYDQEAVLAIVSYYRGKDELPREDFHILDPATASTPNHVLLVLERAFKLKIVDENGNLDMVQLMTVLEQDPVLKENLNGYGLFNGNVLSEIRIRKLLTERPYLRTSLVDLGILDHVGRLDRTALKRSIVRAITNPPTMVGTTTTTSTTVSNVTSTDTITKMTDTVYQVSGLKPKPTKQSTTVTTTTTKTSTTTTPSTGAGLTLNPRFTYVESKIVGEKAGDSNIPIIVIIAVVCGLLLLAVIIIVIVIVIVVRRRGSPRPKDKYHRV